MLRKHFNSMSKRELSRVPFHSWNCISIDMGRREVDLVIKCGGSMKLFIKFLVRNLRTVDGKRGSANPILDAMNK